MPWSSPLKVARDARASSDFSVKPRLTAARKSGAKRGEAVEAARIAREYTGRPFRGLVIAIDHKMMGPKSAVRTRMALFPISQPCDVEAEARCEFFLGKPKPRSDCPDIDFGGYEDPKLADIALTARERRRPLGAHRIENAFCRLKDFRRIATRYDRLARNYLAAVCLVAAIAWWI